MITTPTHLRCDTTIKVMPVYKKSKDADGKEIEVLESPAQFLRHDSINKAKKTSRELQKKGARLRVVDKLGPDAPVEKLRIKKPHKPYTVAKPQTRERIELHDTVLSAISKISMGNAGADLALKLLACEPHGTLRLLDADDMGMRGQTVYIAFDYCGKDPKKFAQALMDRDPEMVRVVNERTQGAKIATGGQS